MTHTGVTVGGGADNTMALSPTAITPILQSQTQAQTPGVIDQLELVANITQNDSAHAQILINEVNNDTGLLSAIRSVQSSVSHHEVTKSFYSASYSSQEHKYSFEGSSDEEEKEDEEEDIFFPEPDQHNEDDEGSYKGHLGDNNYMQLQGPECDLFKDVTSNAWEEVVLGGIRNVIGFRNGLIDDPYLRVFIRAMRYLWFFFPPRENINEHRPPCVPFVLSVVRSRQEFK